MRRSAGRSIVGIVAGRCGSPCLPPSEPMRSSSPSTTVKRVRSTNWGPVLGLPIAVSAHNTEWFWGPGNPNATTVVAWYPGSVDLTSDEAVADLSQYFQHVRVAAMILQQCRGPQPGLGRTCLRLHRSQTSMGNYVADASPLQLSKQRPKSR